MYLSEFRECDCNEDSMSVSENLRGLGKPVFVF